MTDDLQPDVEFPLRDLLGFDIERGEGSATATIARIGPEHLQPHGAVHGGVTFTLVDTAMGAATMSVLDEGSICATTDLQIRYLRPAFEGSLTARAEVVSRGRRMVTLSGEVVDGQDRLVATATAAFALITGERADTPARSTDSARPTGERG